MTSRSDSTRLLTRPLVAVCLADFVGLTAFYLLLSVVPAYATEHGAGDIGAGLTTAALMLSTVAAEFAVPRAMAWFGPRAVLAVGLALLGLPALLLPFLLTWQAVAASCVLRGIGLAIVFVVCGTLSAELIPAERRGEGLGLLGIVAGLPAVFGMPLGVWLAERAGYPVVFVAGAVVALAGLVAVAALPGGAVTAGVSSGPSLSTALRTGALVRPALVFGSTAMAAGVFVTFLPGALPAGSSGLAALILLLQSVAATASRCWAGRWGDRHGAAKLLPPGVAMAAIGVFGMVWVGNPVAVLAGSVVFGAGFGVAQNASLAMLYDRMPASSYGVATALWSAAYDGGLGLGAAGFGLLTGWTGFPVGLIVLGCVLLVATLGSRADRLDRPRAATTAGDRPLPAGAVAIATGERAA
jgi:MFS family permease